MKHTAYSLIDSRSTEWQFYFPVKLNSSIYISKHVLWLIMALLMRWLHCFRLCLLVTFLVSTIVALLPLSTNEYGVAGLYCGMKPTMRALWWRIGLWVQAPNISFEMEECLKVVLLCWLTMNEFLDLKQCYTFGIGKEFGMQNLTVSKF